MQIANRLSAQLFRARNCLTVLERLPALVAANPPQGRYPSGAGGGGSRGGVITLTPVEAAVVHPDPLAKALDDAAEHLAAANNHLEAAARLVQQIDPKSITERAKMPTIDGCIACSADCFPRARSIHGRGPLCPACAESWRVAASTGKTFADWDRRRAAERGVVSRLERRS